MWDNNLVDITQEANFIWGIANKLRGVYMPDKYGDVVIPMTIIRRLECALEDTKDAVVKQFQKNPNFSYKAMCRVSGFQFYNTSELKTPVIKVGAEIPFTRYFYKYQQPTPSEELEARFNELERSVSQRIAKLFGGSNSD